MPHILHSEEVSVSGSSLTRKDRFIGRWLSAP